MAEDKKSFVLYTDSIGLINQLPDDVSGRLFKHIFAYVNDENPKSDELLLNIAFEPIKQQLKRDLKKFIEVKGERSLSGRVGNIKRWNPDLFEQYNQKLITIDEAENIAKHRIAINSESLKSQTVANVAVSVNDNVTVSVNDNVSDTVNDNVILLEKETKKDIMFNFKKSLSDFGIESNLIDDWVSVRKTKKATNTKTAFEIIESELLKCENELKVDRNTAIKYAIEKSWSGFKSDWIKNEQLKNQNLNKESNGRISNEQRLADIFTGGKYDHLI